MTTRARLLFFSLLTCALIALSAASVLGAQATCPDGSDPVRDGGTVSCTTVDPVGNSESSGGHSQETTDSTTSNGTIKNEPQKETECTGPGNSPNC